MILLVKIMCAVELSVCIGVFGCECLSSTSVVRMGTAHFVLMNNAPTSASTAELITALITCKMFRTVPVFHGMTLSLDMKKCPLVRLCASALERYHSLLRIARTMSDAWKVYMVSSCVAT